MAVAFSTSAHADTQTRTSAFDYDPVTGLLTKEIIEPGDPNLCQVTTYTYDQFGNKNSATTRNCNGSAGAFAGSSSSTNTEAAAPTPGSDADLNNNGGPRTTSTTYDAQGRFAVSSTNAAGQTETHTFEGGYGAMLTLTGPNGLTTTWTYDTFGRKASEARADGTSTTTSYTACDSSCPANGKYTVSNTVYGANAHSTVPINGGTTTYNMHGKVIQTQNVALDGNTITTQTVYDNLGRTQQTSRPYKTGSTPLWTSMTYDQMNRVLTTTSPDGSVGTMSYNGFTTTATNAKGQIRTEVKNSQGQLVSVTDAMGYSMYYQYDAYSNLTQTIDYLGNTTTVSYDLRGRKTGMNDPDQGTWSYAYDALGQLIRQTDANNQVVTFAYDILGRMTQRNEPNMVSTWAYDTCDATLNAGGKCVGKLVKETADNGHIRTFLYDTDSRLTAEVDNVDQGYGVAKNFDDYGRVDTLVYPTGFSTYNVYNTNGYLTEVHNVSTGALYWQAVTVDNEGRINKETYGNGVITTRNYDPNTGRLLGIASGKNSQNNEVSNQTFVYDSIGNLTQRYDGDTGLNESFGFDGLNRITATSAVSGASTTNVSVTYNAIGNIMYKSDVGTYTYGSGTNASGQTIQPHAVTSIMMNDGITNFATYTYDANGNMTSGKGRTLTWASWNMPSSISSSNGTFGFVYNSEHERVVEISPTQTIYNISPRLDTGIHVEKRVQASDGSITYVHSVYAGSMPFASVTTDASGNILTTRYLHTDHLGSIIALSDENGNVVERRSYDAWGKRRNSNGTPLTGILSTPPERHGFTGQEELGELGLIHMNGRLYDSQIGRFISADPTVQSPGDMQNYNRYSYIDNNPLAAVDYSGYGFFSFIGSIFKAVVHVVHAVLHNSFIRTAIAMYVGYELAVADGGLFGTADVTFTSAGPQTYSVFGINTTGLSATEVTVGNGAVGGFASSFIQSKGNLKASINGAFTGAAFGWAHVNAYEDPLVHGLIGGASSLASGGNFKNGFLSSSFSTYAGGSGFVKNINNDVEELVVRMSIGGATAALGGGKFENGAMTAGFAYLFNGKATGVHVDPELLRRENLGLATIVGDISTGLEWLSLYIPPVAPVFEPLEIGLGYGSIFIKGMNGGCNGVEGVECGVDFAVGTTGVALKSVKKVSDNVKETYDSAQFLYDTISVIK